MPNRPAPSTPRPAPLHGPRTGRARHADSRACGELAALLAAGDHAAIAPLRHLARSALTAWATAPELAEDVLLVLSELATNALRHTDGPAQIRLCVRNGRLVIDATDTSSQMPDLDTGPDDGAEDPHGYGLAHIAVALADSVTTRLDPAGGKTVTATFAIDDLVE